ncbi:ATP-dependent RNA helicase glh-1-like isoform X2 [Salvelinus fontinalis]|uniref:ATP-dependent RNA helicase glh-1-like isoform X2 n=1 Tax=Salvelinus fontinalis TaxID=8038 RepID=UPI0024858CB8|nr:ATP-dependent RNA helicase glh-1-like isoform X2 [Salvelinus fontinalis]
MPPQRCVLRPQNLTLKGRVRVGFLYGGGSGAGRRSPSTSGSPHFGGASGAGTLVVGPGLGTLAGGPGLGTLAGGPGLETVAGGPGLETVAGGPGLETVAGGSGLEAIAGGSGLEAVAGGFGLGIVTGGSGLGAVAGGSGTGDRRWSLRTGGRRWRLRTGGRRWRLRTHTCFVCLGPKHTRDSIQEPCSVSAAPCCLPRGRLQECLPFFRCGDPPRNRYLHNLWFWGFFQMMMTLGQQWGYGGLSFQKADFTDTNSGAPFPLWGG